MLRSLDDVDDMTVELEGKKHKGGCALPSMTPSLAPSRLRLGHALPSVARLRPPSALDAAAPKLSQRTRSYSSFPTTTLSS